MHVMVTSLLSEDARIALRPFATYRELGSEPAPTLGRALLGPAAWLLFVACFVSWTTSGALLVEHLAIGPVFWVFVPLVQSLAVILVARAFAGASSAPRVLRLYYAGHAPWLALLAVVAGICLVAPTPWPVFRWLLQHGVLFVALIAAFTWCIVLTYAMFRGALSLDRRQSIAATAAHYVACILLFSSWFVVTGQLLPLWGIM